MGPYAGTRRKYESGVGKGTRKEMFRGRSRKGDGIRPYVRQLAEMLRDKRYRRRRKGSRRYHHAGQRREIFQRSSYSQRCDAEESQDTRIADRSGCLDQCSHPEEPRRRQVIVRNEEYDGDRLGSPFLPPERLATVHRRHLYLAEEAGAAHRGCLPHDAPNGPQGKSAADVAMLKSMIVSPNIVAVDTAALALFNQVKKLDMAAVSHLGKGEALKLGSTDLKKINIKRIKI